MNDIKRNKKQRFREREREREREKEKNKNNPVTRNRIIERLVESY